MSLRFGQTRGPVRIFVQPQVSKPGQNALLTAVFFDGHADIHLMVTGPSGARMQDFNVKADGSGRAEVALYIEPGWPQGRYVATALGAYSHKSVEAQCEFDVK